MVDKSKISLHTPVQYKCIYLKLSSHEFDLNLEIIYNGSKIFHLVLQVPVIQVLLGQVGLVSGDQMLSIWRYVVVGAVVAAAVLTPSTDPLTQMLLAAPLLGLYLGGAWAVKLIGR